MNRQLMRDAVSNLRNIVIEKGRYRRLLLSEVLNAEVYLQQIMLEIELAPPTLRERLLGKNKQ